jgi:hypothetical protein
MTAVGQETDISFGAAFFKIWQFPNQFFKPLLAHF